MITRLKVSLVAVVTAMISALTSTASVTHAASTTTFSVGGISINGDWVVISRKEVVTNRVALKGDRVKATQIRLVPGSASAIPNSSTCTLTIVLSYPYQPSSGNVGADGSVSDSGCGGTYWDHTLRQALNGGYTLAAHHYGQYTANNTQHTDVLSTLCTQGQYVYYSNEVEPFNQVQGGSVGCRKF